MKKILFLILLLLLVTFQISFSLPNLSLGALILFLSLSPTEDWSLGVAFLLGLFLDLTRGDWWGLSSLFLLLLVLFFFLYQRRFFSQSLWFLGLFTFFSSLFYDYLILGRLSLMASFVLVLLLLSVRFGLNYFFVGRKGLKIGLKSK